MKNKVLFLDRDGIINEEYNYVYKIKDFHFCDGIFDLCRYYQKNGYLIVVITNQAGIARGYYTENDFNILTEWMIEKFNENSINISKVYFCPHHPEFTGNCVCRKPNPGMIVDAQKEFNIDLNKSVLIGDKESDIKAGLNAGIGRTIFIGTTKNTKATAQYADLRNCLDKENNKK